MAAVYIWRIVEIAYFQHNDSRDRTREVPLGLLIPTWTLVLANIWFGIDSSLTVGMAAQAAHALIGATP